MQADAHPTMSHAATSATTHHHPHHVQYSTLSLLGASVPARLAIVAGVAAVLWCAIAWALG